MRKISVVIPVYNVEKYLEKCIKSVLGQTYENIEIILVNDGSTDASLKICRAFEKNHSNIFVIDKKNGGLSDARNYGLAKVTGEYVLFVDSDDYLDENACAKFVELLDKNGNLDIVTADALMEKKGVNSLLSHSNFAEDNVVSGIEYLYEETKINKMLIMVWVNLYRVKFLKENCLFFKKGILHEDEEFTPRCFLKAKKVMHIGYPVYHYLIRENSITTKKDYSKNAHDLFETLYDLEKIYDNLDEKYSSVLKDSLSIKYLSMAQLLHNSNKKHGVKFDLDFIKRNSYATKTKLKYVLFSTCRPVYYFLNIVSKKMES